MYESGEDYLEAILMIRNEKEIVRSVDVARKLMVSKPSVSRAMGILKDDGYIFFDENQHIVLTEKGFGKASSIYSRHKLLTAFLMKIAGVTEEQAEKNACRVEHCIDSDIVAGIESWMKNN
ncbi:MAG: metal-dependent transcriptional regulator [Treponema porcinum]|uniref:metal-dependent transcriptional regulator n=1 Tax=Treponema porcinum TaxID=261392 RepID=UPI002353B70D|nr:metal-dependent transcriptional regulator [Treponema porcinum]MCI7533602.1 metal-dependent transcriptional regulator [Treponema porcinum]